MGDFTVRFYLLGGAAIERPYTRNEVNGLKEALVSDRNIVVLGNITNEDVTLIPVRSVAYVEIIKK